MNEMLQNAFVLLLVGVAAAYLLWNTVGWWLRKPSGSCGGCHGCGKTSAAPTDLVALEAKPAPSTLDR